NPARQVDLESVMAKQSSDMICLSRARKALAEAKEIDEVKAIRDHGQAAIKWAKSRRDMSFDAVADGAEIVLRAERILGTMLSDTTVKGGVRHKFPDGTYDRESVLNKHDISKTQSHRWQMEATVTNEDFDSFVLESREANRLPTSSGLMKLAKRDKHRKAWAQNGKSIEGTCQSIQELIDAGKKFHCIYADPPWKYGNQQTRASTDNHYGTMTLDEICNEPVSSVAFDDAHLHLWTTNGFLFDAKRVIEAWGFEYRSCFVWCKNQYGIGNYWRVAHEFLLLGIRGSATNFLAKDQISWLATDRTKHSRKPPEVRERIEKVSPSPRLEMYGREAVDGWMVHGNQVQQ